MSDHLTIHGLNTMAIDFTKDSEYIRIFKEHTKAMKKQKSKKRHPPKPPMSPFKES